MRKLHKPKESLQRKVMKKAHYRGKVSEVKLSIAENEKNYAKSF